MKRILILLFVAVVAVCCTACTAPAPVEAEVGDIVADEEDAPELESPDETVDGENGELVTGTVVYYDDSTLFICSLGNKSLNFLVASPEIDKSETRGLKIGSETDIYYTGEINGSDTSAAQVVKLVQSLKQSAVRTDESVAGGVIVSADASLLSILTFDGEELTFSIAGDDIDKEHTNGLTAGDYVTVFYEGEIDGGNAESVHVVKLVQ